MINKCRICGNKDLKMIIDLGDQNLSGYFPKNSLSQPPTSPLVLLKCNNDKKNNCGVLQLGHNVSLDEMYGASYGYYSSLSKSMIKHLENKAKVLSKYVDLNEDDYVLDIGCNDGTLINAFDNKNRVGIDPSSKKFKEFFDDDIILINDYFNREKIETVTGNNKYKIITSIAMFYDVSNPLLFINSIRGLLHDDGIWALELAYLPHMLKYLSYDQICHEHLIYYSLKDIKYLTDMVNMKIIDIFFNEVNGGSIYLYVAKNKSSYKPNLSIIKKILDEEKKLYNDESFSRFSRRIKNHKYNLLHTIKLIEESGKSIMGYGASTKGNIIINYSGISNTQISQICDANIEKQGRLTPGSGITIVPKKREELKKHDYLLVFIWHLRKEVITDEIDYLKNGGTLVFVLPRIHFVDITNYVSFLNNDLEDLCFST